MADFICEKTGKKGYLSKAEASATRVRVQRQMTKNRPKLDVYRCEFCGRFHLGHNDIWKGGRR